MSLGSDPHPKASMLRKAFDEIADAVDFDSDNPGWTPALIELHHHSLRRKLHLLPEAFFTPVYSPESLPDSVWSARLDAGVRYDADRQLDFLANVQRFNDELAAFAQEPDEQNSAFYWGNTQFSHGDAVLYYSLLRHLAPRRVIEVGGGYSTLLASAAAVRNAATLVSCIEPYPRAFLRRGLPRVELLQEPVQGIPLRTFEDLGEGDVLFYDGSHISKTGSDVNHVLLRVLPALRMGVWIHLHDIFLPFEYPRAWAQERLYWNEQYVLAALLSGSRKFELVVANYFLWKVANATLAAIMPPGVQPGGASFWIRAIS